MTNFIFLPVPIAGIQQQAETWREGVETKGKPPPQILMNHFQAGWLKGTSRFIGLKCLRSVRPNDKLYVMTHGLMPNPDTYIPTHVGDTRSGNDQKRYTPSELAKVLEKEGLTKSIIEVSVFACGSGLPSPLGPWARRLRDEMRNLGYSRVAVTGYLGDVRYSYAYRQTPDGGYTDEQHKGIELGDGLIYQASSHKVRF